YGAHFTPRVGNEVLIGYIDGDPDKPMIVGSVHHALNNTPFSHPHDRTKSGIISRSTPGGGGGHELTFQDRAGEEIVAMRSSKTLSIHAAADGALSTGGPFELRVGADAVEAIGGESRASYGGDRVENVAGERRVDVAKDDRATVMGDQVVSVAGKKS